MPTIDARVRGTGLAALLLLGPGALSCTFREARPDGSTDAEAGVEPGDFIATEAAFAGYATWTPTTEPRQGPGALGSLIEGAHMAQDATVSRRAFANAVAMRRTGGGEHEAGSVYVKELRSADGTLLGMGAAVKRSGGFNQANRGWEWFMLRPDGTINRRGAVLDPDCNGCHTRSSGGDYIFTR